MGEKNQLTWFKLIDCNNQIRYQKYEIVFLSMIKFLLLGIFCKRGRLENHGKKEI